MRAVKDILKNPVCCIANEASYNYFRELGSSVCFDLDETDGKRGLMPFRRTVQSGKQLHKTAPDEWITALGKHSFFLGNMTGALIGETHGKN